MVMRIELSLLGPSIIADYVRESNGVRINVAFKDMGVLSLMNWRIATSGHA